jgi:sodium/potassium/calcium exchanger 6
VSNSVLGVSVLAWGNSIGDLVSNTSIARDGFPTMAFAGCFAGPMFNLLVGIGLALTIAIVSRGPVSMGEPSSLVYVGFVFLFASLLLNLGLAAFDGFRYRPRLCYTLYILYASFVMISIAAVAMDEEEE